ncbi:MAG: HAD family phosphatase [Clostridia bacterium]|nr:HAD family phosphatase [Clostridia bacterium]
MEQKTYIFDFDGTLVDSMDTWAGVYIKLLDENGISYPSDIVKIITPLGNSGAAKYCISLGLHMTAEEIAEHNHEILIKRYGYEIPEKSNVTKTLKRLKEKGCSLNVLTASPHKYLDPCLKRLGIYELFDNVWSIDDFGHSKGETVIYEKAAQRLGVKVSDCVFADDNLIALKTAKEAGMVTLGVYDKSSHDLTEEIKMVSDKYITDFDQI